MSVCCAPCPPTICLQPNLNESDQDTVAGELNESIRDVSDTAASVFLLSDCCKEKGLKWRDRLQAGEKDWRAAIETEYSERVSRLFSDWCRGLTSTRPSQSALDIRWSDYLRSLFKAFCFQSVDSRLQIDKPQALTIAEIVKDLFSLDQSPIATLNQFQVTHHLQAQQEQDFKTVFDFNRDLILRRWVLTCLATQITKSVQCQMKKRLQEEKTESSLQDEKTWLREVSVVETKSFGGQIVQLLAHELGNQMRTKCVGHHCSSGDFVASTLVKEMVNDIYSSFKKFTTRCQSKERSWNWSTHSLTSDLVGGPNQVDAWIEVATNSLMRQLKRELSKVVSLPFVVFPQDQSVFVLQTRCEEELTPCKREVKDLLHKQALAFRRAVESFKPRNLSQ